MRSTQELNRIDEIIELNLSLELHEIMELIKSEGLTISRHRLRYKINFLTEGTAGTPKPVRPEPQFFDHLKWKDTNPDRVQDHEAFDYLVAKFHRQNKIPNFGHNSGEGTQIPDL